MAEDQKLKPNPDGLKAVGNPGHSNMYTTHQQSNYVLYNMPPPSISVLCWISETNCPSVLRNWTNVILKHSAELYNYYSTLQLFGKIALNPVHRNCALRTNLPITCNSRSQLGAEGAFAQVTQRRSRQGNFWVCSPLHHDTSAFIETHLFPVFSAEGSRTLTQCRQVCVKINKMKNS